MTLKLGVPSKGRLMEKTFDWFSDRGIQLEPNSFEDITNYNNAMGS